MVSGIRKVEKNTLYKLRTLKDTTMTSSTVKITQLLPDNKLGRSRIGYNIDLGEIGFRRFLSNLPDNQAAHYAERAEVLKQTSVEVVMPGECLDTFDLGNPEQAIEEMGALSRHHKLNTTTYILDRVKAALQVA